MDCNSYLIVFYNNKSDTVFNVVYIFGKLIKYSKVQLKLNVNTTFSEHSGSYNTSTFASFSSSSCNDYD